MEECSRNYLQDLLGERDLKLVQFLAKNSKDESVSLPEPESVVKKNLCPNCGFDLNSKEEGENE